MPEVNVPFAGQTLVVPASYFQDNISAVGGAPPTTPPLILIGFAYGQEPFTAETYLTPQELLAAIRGGPVSGYVPFLTFPSPELNGAQQITLINVGQNTQSELTLYSGASGVIDLLSADYGVPSNLLQAMVQTGSQAGKKLTLYDGYSDVTLLGDNLGVPFRLAYTGEADGVTYSVVYEDGVAAQFVVESPTAGESVTITLGPGAYETVSQVVQYLNGTGFYTAVSVSSTNGLLPATELDEAADIALAAPVSGALQYANVTSVLNDMVYWVNRFGDTLATAAVASGVTSGTDVWPDNLPLTPFIGATSVPPTNNDYASGFNLALTLPGWVVFADSNSDAVRALGTQHAATASQTVNGKWRRFFTGSSLGDDVSDAIAAAQAAGTITTTYVYPGIRRVDTTTGQTVLYDGLHAAAAAAGMATGNPVATPLTNKSLVAVGVETELSVSEINQLQSNGVMPIWISPQTRLPTITSDMTTWQANSSAANVFNQQVACRWYLAYSLVNSTSRYVGTIASPSTQAAIANTVKNTLNALIYTPGNPNGVLAAWDRNSLVLTYTGSQQLLSIEVSVQLVGQNRFITQTVNVLPLDIVTTLETAA